MAGGRKNKKDAVAHRRATVARLFLQGMWQADIAKHVNVTQQQVSLDLKAIRIQWSKNTVDNYNQKVDEELAKINLLEQEYHEAWSRSKEQFKSRSIKGRAIGEENPTQLVEKHERTEERVGDPRYLQGIQWCIEQRCKIMGIPDKAPKQDVVHTIDLKNLTPEELLVLSKLKSKQDVT